MLVHWACAKISASLQQQDDQLRDVLVAKLQSYRGIRYSIIAGHAESVGRKGLATMLLEYETRAADQVSQLESLLTQGFGQQTPKGRGCIRSVGCKGLATLLLDSSGLLLLHDEQSRDLLVSGHKVRDLSCRSGEPSGTHALTGSHSRS